MAMHLEDCGSECADGELTPSFGGTHGIWLKNDEKEARDPDSHVDGEQLEGTSSAELVSMVQKLGLELAKHLEARLSDGERKLRMDIEDIQANCLCNAEHSLTAANKALFNQVVLQNLELAQRVEECELRLSEFEEKLQAVGLPGSFDGMANKLAAHTDDKLTGIPGELTKTKHLQARIGNSNLHSSEFCRRMKLLDEKLANSLKPLASEESDTKFPNDRVIYGERSEQHLRFSQSVAAAEVAPQQSCLQIFSTAQSDIADQTTASEFSSLNSTTESFGSSVSARSPKLIDTERPALFNDEANPSESSPSLPRSRSSPPCKFRQLSSRGATDVKATLENLTKQCRQWIVDDESGRPQLEQVRHPYAKSLTQSVTL